MDSEPELERRYADLTMIIRPDQRHLKIFNVNGVIKVRIMPFRSIFTEYRW